MAISIQTRPHKYSFSRNPVQYTFAVPEFADAGAFIQIRIYSRTVGGAAGSEVLLVDEKIKPSGAAVPYNIQDILDGNMDYQMPDFSGTTVQAATNIKEYFITYRQISDASPDPAFFTDSAFIRYVVKGGIANPQWDWNNYFLNYMPANKPFLTWQPGNRFIGPTDAFFISFLNQTAAAALTLATVVYYTDGTTATLDIPFGNSGQNQLYHIQAGPGALGLTALNPAKKIYRYTLQVVETATPANTHTAAYSYYIDYRQFYNAKCFHYYNSLGGLECIRIRGEIQHDINRNFTENEKYLGTVIPGTPPSDQYIQSGINKIDAFKGDTGYIHTQAEKDALQEILLTKFAWERLYNKNLRIYITTKSANIRNTGEALYNMGLEWRYSFTNVSYTPLSADLGVGAVVTESGGSGGGGGGGGTFYAPASNIQFSGITDTSFVATFSQPNPAPSGGFNYQLNYWNGSAFVSAGISGNNTSGIINFTGLTPATDYQVIIIADYGGGNLSSELIGYVSTIAASGGGTSGSLIGIGPMTGSGTVNKNANVFDMVITLQGFAENQNIAECTTSACWPSRTIPATAATQYDSTNAMLGTVYLSYDTAGRVMAIGPVTMASGDYLEVTFID